MKNIRQVALLLAIMAVGGADLQAAGTPAGVPTVEAGLETAVNDQESKAAEEAAKRPATQGDLDGINTQIAILQDQLNRTLTLNTASTTRSLTISGTLQSRYTLGSNRNAIVSVTDPSKNYKNTSNFSIPLASVSLKGSLRKDYEDGRNLDYAASFQATSAAASNYNLNLADAYLQYAVLQTLDLEKPTFYIQAGQFKKLFGVEAVATEDKQPAITLATFATKLGLSTREIGLQLRGDLLPAVDTGYNFRVPLIEYSAGIFNGNGSNVSDTNRNKDFIGRIALNAPVDYNSPYRGLSAGISYYNGTNDLSFTKNGTSITLAGAADKRRLGYDISYVASPIGFTAEYAAGWDQKFRGTTYASESAALSDRYETRSAGYTLTLFYQWGDQFLKNVRNQTRADDWWPTTYQPFVRYDRWDPDKAVSSNEFTALTFGFNLFFAQTTKLQVNYTLSEDKAPSPVLLSGLPLKKRELNVQFQYGF